MSSVALERGDFAVDHYVHRGLGLKFDVADGTARSQGMFDVRAVVEFGQACAAVRAVRSVPSGRIRSGRRVGSALGAIIIVPPVNLLLLNVRKRQRRSSQSCVVIAIAA